MTIDNSITDRLHLFFLTLVLYLDCKHKQCHEHLHKVSQETFVTSTFNAEGCIFRAEEFTHPVFRCLLVGVYCFRSGCHVFGKYVLSVMLCLDIEIALLTDFSKVGSWIDPLQLIVCRDVNDTKMKMLTSGSCASITRNAQLLTSIDRIAFLNGYFTKMHVLHSCFSSVFTSILHRNGFTATSCSSMIDTDNHAITFCGKNIVLICLDVYAVVYLRFAFVYRIFALTVR